MTDNENRTVDLVVGPLDNFDDAVAFGDALYGLDGVTRLALNEFEGNRANFTFSARSLESVTQGLQQMQQFHVSGVEHAVDGTLQVRVGGEPQAFTQPAPSATPSELEQTLARFAAEEESRTGLSFQASDPFARPEAPASITPSPEPFAAHAAPAEFTMPEPEPANEFGFEQEPAEAWQQPAAPMSTPYADAAPSYEPTITQFPGFDRHSEPSADVAEIIYRLADELRGTAESLAELAAQLSERETEHVSPAASFDQTWAEPAAPIPSPWSDDETPAPAMPASDHAAQAQDPWQSNESASGWAPVAAAEPADEPQERAWEAPRMPSVGMMSGGGGEPNGAPPSRMEDAQTIAMATVQGRKPSQIHLMASGFASFGLANDFIAAVRLIPGVRNVAISELDQGRLRLALDYFGSEPLESHLQQLREFPHQVVRASGKEIEIQLLAA
ncbi:MAG: hypothetical protein WEB00_15315 [Dehalococcoidia bacterium]